MQSSSIAVIGSIDSSGGAGINQDIRVASRLGFNLLTCVGTLTLQNENGVELIHSIPLSVFEKTLDSILGNVNLRFVKIGALSNVEQINLLCEKLDRPRGFLVVHDPVISPSRGKAFLDNKALPSLRRLVSISDYGCPNLTELGILTNRSINSFENAVSIAQDFARNFQTSLLIKGGHGGKGMVEEAFVSPKETVTFQHARENWKYSHGTGCALATAFACFLAKENKSAEAFKLASDWVVSYYNSINGNNFAK